jgi:multidrug efflux pump subunit AcrA (membrane-fusion protein)
MQPVDVGFLQDGEVLITGGLSAGERLIVTGHRRLRDGEPVRVAEAGE